MKMFFRDKSFLQAADEVEDIARIHIEMIREAGIELDLTGLGFSF